MDIYLNLVEVLLERVRLEAAVLDARLGPRDPELNLFNINLEEDKFSTRNQTLFLLCIY